MNKKNQDKVTLIAEHKGFEIYRFGEPGDYGYVYKVTIGDEDFYSECFTNYDPKRIPSKLTNRTWNHVFSNI